MLRIKRLLALLIISAVMLFSSAAYAQHTFDYTHFSQIPVSHQGRVKPLGRVAQLTLKQMTQIDLSAHQASAWLATVLFDPQSADQPAIFHITNPHLIHVLELDPPTSADAAFYNFQTLNRAFGNKADLIISLRNANEGQLQKDQQDLLALYAQVTYYEQLKNAMTLLLPLKEPAQKRYIDLPASRSTKSLELIAAQGTLNQVFRVVPYHTPAHELTWMAPWEYWQQDRKLHGDDAPVPPLLNKWSDLAHAYINNDAAAWDKAGTDVLSDTLHQSEAPLLAYQLKAEILYHIFSPYFYSLCFYFAALITSLLALKFAPRILYRMTWTAFSLGLLLHLCGITARMFILQRPPVSNLYESILFVGAMLTAMGLWYIHRKKENSLLPVLALASTGLQLLGFALNDDGDSLQVLQAVLDTKFWLATHVIIITMGYALCLVTGLMAHAALWVSVRQPSLILHTHRFYKRAFYFSLLALLFVSIGTLLGGVWADQSWGRFWGWDPKENGALLIVLWLVWLLHGRISRHFSDRGLVIGLSLLNIIVGLSWIGVNLLGIGLHSYGFISGSALSLIVLLCAELIFFTACGILYFRGKSRHA